MKLNHGSMLYNAKEQKNSELSSLSIYVSRLKRDLKGRYNESAIKNNHKWHSKVFERGQRKSRNKPVIHQYEATFQRIRNQKLVCCKF